MELRKTDHEKLAPLPVPPPAQSEIVPKGLFASSMAQEIDLVDLGVMFWRRRVLIAMVAGALIVLTVIAALLHKPSYNYTTAIQLGSMLDSTGTMTPLISPQTAVASLHGNYIPSAIDQYQQQQQVEIPSLKVDVSSSVDSSTVTLTCKAKGKIGSACSAVEKLAAAQFVQSNAAAINTVRANLQASLDSAQLDLQSLQDPAVFNVQKLAAEKSIADSKVMLAQLQSDLTQHEHVAKKSIADAEGTLANMQSAAVVLTTQKQMLDESNDLLKKQIAQLHTHIARVRNTMVTAAKETSDPTQAMTNLLLNTEVQGSVNQVNSLENRLTIDNPQSLAAVNKSIGDNSRDQSLQKQTIDLVKFQLQEYVENNMRQQILQKQTITQNELALQKLLFTHGQDIQNQEIGINRLKSQLSNLQDNRVLGEPLRSINPVGLGRGGILGIGIVLSFLFAFFAALFAGYVEQVRVRLGSDKLVSPSH